MHQSPPINPSLTAVYSLHCLLLVPPPESHVGDVHVDNGHAEQDFSDLVVSNNQGKHAQFQLGWNLRVRDLVGIFKSYIAASFNSVLCCICFKSPCLSGPYALRETKSSFAPSGATSCRNPGLSKPSRALKLRCTPLRSLPPSPSF